LHHYPDNGLANFVINSRYTRFRRELGRRETFAEAVQRAEQMHRGFFATRLDRVVTGEPAATPADPADHPRLRGEVLGATVGDLLARAFTAVQARRVLPSLRSLQFGGPAILRHQARLYNCAFSLADRVDFFREFFYLLLAGTGCGFSVQRQHVAQLPALPRRGPERQLPVYHHAVADSIEGWANALDVLVRSHVEGFRAAFNYALIRPRGAPLVTAGGRAPGHLPLERALTDVDGVLRRASGRALRPVEVYDLCLYVARAVLSRGPRRSASICLFSPDDEEMMNAKTGAWAANNPQRAASNNSAVLRRDALDATPFQRLFAAQKAFGEPSFYFSDHPDYGCNPCGEAGLHPVLTAPLDAAGMAHLRPAGGTAEPAPGTRFSGWQMCNLSTINGAALRVPGDFLTACVHATVLGTLQAAYTDFGYLGPVTRTLNELDALLGVSICGFMDNPGLLFDPRLLARGARLCRAVNQLVAAAIGIRPAARVTCVKPEGTASLLFGTAPGIHPYHARHYFRRVRANRDSAIYRCFQAVNPAMTEPSLLRPQTEAVITFPVAAPPDALRRDELGAVEFLQRVLLVQEHWVLAGEAPATRSPGLHHNVSHTCTVRPDEWAATAEFIWQNRQRFTGVALLGRESLPRYPQAPLEAVCDRAGVARWNQLGCRQVDYSASNDEDDPTGGDDVDDCAGGDCGALPALPAEPGQTVPQESQAPRNFPDGAW